MDTSPWIRDFATLGLNDVAQVGGKTASIGEMSSQLHDARVRVPEGFALTAAAYRHALDRAGAWPALHAALDGLNRQDVGAIATAAARARALVEGLPMPPEIESALRTTWREWCGRCHGDLRVAVRSSATAEDLPGASFAGQHDTLLDVGDEEALLAAIRHCQASLFTDRAVAYRIDHGFDHFQVALSVAVMRMVDASSAASGVIFTLDTESGHPGVILVTGTWGLGDALVQGLADPDEFLVHKAGLRAGHRCVLSRQRGRKQQRLVGAARPRSPVWPAG